HAYLMCLEAIPGRFIGFSLNIIPSWNGIPHYRRAAFGEAQHGVAVDTATPTSDNFDLIF
ncbi:MAG TPA: hypothetical protein VKC60_04480, partial [Opitutaceae bacterium]|nr:hypothetical protein [Opitutaceae bacterium]